MLRFFRTARNISNYAGQTRSTHTTGKIILYYWEPYPDKIFGLRNKPLLGHLSGGNAGHISMEIQYSSGKKAYLSVWPKEMEEHIQGKDNCVVIKPVNNSNSLEKDIETEQGKLPLSKTIGIDLETEKKLETTMKKLDEEFNKDPRERLQWSLINNCATFVSNALYESGIISTKQLLATTPHYVFYMTDKAEQKMYWQNYKTASYFD